MGLIWADTLTWPPSGNTLTRTYRNIQAPSVAYVEWTRTNLASIAATPMLGVIDYQVHLRLVFRPPTLHPYDLDNRAKAVQDVLVKAGVIIDDNMDILNPVHLEHVPKIKGEPGQVIVELYSL